MRVITGEKKGRKLAAPMGLATRPTSEMTKEAVFSAIQFEIEGANFCDLFAGSGQMGIEALSRGARRAYFVENSSEANSCIRENIKSLELADESEIISGDVFTFIKTTSVTFDIVFLDPPYNSQMLHELLPLIGEKVSLGGVILCETEKREETPSEAGKFTKVKEYKYGKAKISAYRRKGI